MRAGTIVREARAGAGLSQRALARRAGLPQASVSRIERGIVAPRTDTLDRLLRVCGKDVELVARSGTGVDVTLVHEALAMTPGSGCDVPPWSRGTSRRSCGGRRAVNDRGLRSVRGLPDAHHT